MHRSCGNSSYRDLLVAAHILKGKKVNPDVSLHISQGSRQVLQTASMHGALNDLSQLELEFWKMRVAAASAWALHQRLSLIQ